MKIQIYYGLTYLPEYKALRQEMQEALSGIIVNNDFIRGKDWLCYKYVSFEDGYERFKEFIEKVNMKDDGNSI